MIVHLALNGVAESSLGVGIDVIHTAAQLSERELVEGLYAKTLLRQRVVSVDGGPVRSGSGRVIAVEDALSLRRLGPGDVLVVPGWFSATESSIKELLTRDETRRAIDAMVHAADKGLLLAASCSATFALASTGALDGKQATTAWWLAPAFARRFPDVRLTVERMVVEAGRVLTAGSAFAHADLMLAIVARIASPSLSQWVARYLVLDHRPSQSRYMALEHLRVADAAVQKAERFILDNLDRQLTLDELARAAAVSTRTLARRVRTWLGITPLEWVQRLRVAHAAHLLATSRASVEDIAAQVGYADSAAFRRTFRRFMGRPPRRF